MKGCVRLVFLNVSLRAWNSIILFMTPTKTGDWNLLSVSAWLIIHISVLLGELFYLILFIFKYNTIKGKGWLHLTLYFGPLFGHYCYVYSSFNFTSKSFVIEFGQFIIEIYCHIGFKLRCIKISRCFLTLTALQISWI